MSIPTSTAFVGLDVSKDDLVSAVDGQKETKLFPNNARGRADLIAYLDGLGRHLCVALEATGGYEWPVWEALEGQGIPVRQVSPAEVRAFATSLGQKSKTDPIDAQIIAAFLAFRPDAGRQLPAEDVRHLRGLASFRQPLYAAHPVRDIAAKPFVYAVTLCPHAGSKSAPWRRLAQAMRASLAASATMTTLRCARASSARSQAPSAVS